ncbi:MAG: HYR domain-containing protein [Saprospiraceae bacterium]|nr:HYR domain-containing protein [Saprospiraceae bacterium]
MKNQISTLGSQESCKKTNVALFSKFHSPMKFLGFMLFLLVLNLPSQIKACHTQAPVSDYDHSGMGTFSGSYTDNSADHVWFIFNANAGDIINVMVTTNWSGGSTMWNYRSTDGCVNLCDYSGNGTLTLLSQNGAGSNGYNYSFNASVTTQYGLQLDSWLCGSGTYTVTISGSTAPTILCSNALMISCPANVVVNANPGTCEISSGQVNLGVPTVTPNCNILSIVNNAPNSYPNGVTIVKWTVTDFNGATATCNQTVTVIGGNPNIVICAPNPKSYDALGRTSIFSAINLAGTGTNYAVVNPGAAVNLSFNRSTSVNGGCGGCCGCITQHYVGMNDGIGTVFSSCLFSTTGGSGGAHSINFTAPSNPGVYYINPTGTWWFSCNQFGIPSYSRNASNPVAVLVVGCGQTDCQDITVTAAANVCTAIVNYPALCAVDNDPGATIMQTAGFASGVSYPVGTTVNTYKATDVNGNTTTCSFNVNVLAFTCKYPIQVYHRDTTTNSAKIKWKAQSATCSTGGLYELRNRYELSPGVWSPWTSWANKTGPALEHNFTGLLSGSFYHYQIRTKCGPGQTSTEINGWFHTLGGGNNLIGEEHQISDVQTNLEGLEELPSDLQIMPNPATDFADVKIQGFERTDKEIMMIDLYGKLIFRVKLTADQNNIELDLKTLQVRMGVYLVRVANSTKQKTQQLMIQN